MNSSITSVLWRKASGLALASMLGLGLLLGFGSAAQAQQDQVEICHKPGTPAEHIMFVSQSAVSAHTNHGDTLITTEQERTACGGEDPVIDTNPEDNQCVIVSDTQTFEDGEPASLLSFVHSGWNHTLESVASWIWGDDPVVNPAVEETQVFTRTFYLDSVPTSGALEITSDNGFKVELNTVVQSDQLSNDSVFTSVANVPLTGLVEGENTLVITVVNKAGDANPEANPAGLIYKLTVTGADCDKAPAENSCVAPDATGALAEIELGATPPGEDTLQEILDDEFGVNGIDAEGDQYNFQQWNGSNNTVNFSVENIGLAKNSGHRHLFGYYLNGSTTFVPVFRDGSVAAGDAGIPQKNFGESATFSIANVSDVVFAIADWNGTSYTYYKTKKSLNADTADHAVVYNPNDNEYVLAFEDLAIPSPSDEDYNDLVVKLNVTSCGDAVTAKCEPQTELLKNGGFETPGVSGAWNIVPSGTSGLDWMVAWINNAGAPLIANAEFQKSVSAGWTPHTGTQYAELDSDWGGPSSSQTGEAGAVTMSQDIPTVIGKKYTFSFWFSPRPDQVAGENKVEALADGVVIGTTAAVAGNNATTQWTQYSFEFTATDGMTTVALRDAAGNPNNSVGSFVDDASLVCAPKDDPVTQTEIRVIASKIVCTDEDDLPNWGEGGHSITATTAEDWIGEGHPSCSLVPGWQFEWGDQSAGDPGRDVIGVTGGEYTPFGPTDSDGVTSVDIPLSALENGETEFHLREVLQKDFIPFTYDQLHTSNDDDVSAEFYCSGDVLNYDNYDFIRNAQSKAGTTQYCVAWNVPVDDGGEQCNPEAQQVLTSSDDSEGGLLTWDQMGPASLVSLPHINWADAIDALWIWKDTATSADDAADGTAEVFTRTFEIVGTPSDASLDIAVDNSVEIIVNGDSFTTISGEHNYEATTTLSIPANLLNDGMNTVSFKVTNMDHESANTPATNPAGLLYKLTLNSNECTDDEDENDTDNIGTISTIKRVIGDGPQTTFLFLIDDGSEDPIEVEATITDGESGYGYGSDEEVAPGHYSVYEEEKDDWVLTNVTCIDDNGTEGDDDDFEVSNTGFNVQDGHNITCEFTNTYVGEEGGVGTLRIVKNAHDSNDRFVFNIDGYETSLDAAIDTVTGDDVNSGVTEVQLLSGSYSVTEEQQPDWTLDSVECTYDGESEGTSIEYGHNIYIEAGETVTCTFENSYTGNGGGGNGGGGGGNDNARVLGASTDATCGPLLSTFMRLGQNNDATEVTELQNFLNGEMNSGLTIDGIFGAATDAAVRAFQLKYWEDVLQPWFGIPGSLIQDQDDSTGYVYKTTQWKINDIYCPSLELPMPELP